MILNNKCTTLTNEHDDDDNDDEPNQQTQGKDYNPNKRQRRQIKLQLQRQQTNHDNNGDRFDNWQNNRENHINHQTTDKEPIANGWSAQSNATKFDNDTHTNTTTNNINTYTNLRKCNVDGGLCEMRFDVDALPHDAATNVGPTVVRGCHASNITPCLGCHPWPRCTKPEPKLLKNPATSSIGAPVGRSRGGQTGPPLTNCAIVGATLVANPSTSTGSLHREGILSANLRESWSSPANLESNRYTQDSGRYAGRTGPAIPANSIRTTTAQPQSQGCGGRDQSAWPVPPVVPPECMDKPT